MSNLNTNVLFISCVVKKLMFRAQIMFTLLQTAKPMNWNKTFTHIEYRAGAVDRKGLVSIFRLSGFQSSLLLIHFLYGPPDKTKSHNGSWQNLSDVWRFTFEIGAAQLRSVTKLVPPQPFLCVSRGPIRYDGISCRCKSYLPYSVNIKSIFSSIWASAGEGLPSYT